MERLILCMLIIATVANMLDAKTLGDAMQGKAVVCYVIPDSGKFDIDDLDPSICTHLVHAFGGLDEATMTIKSLDPYQDLERWNGRAGFKGFVGLKQQHPHVKVIRSIGGWSEGSLKFSKMAASRDNRRTFIQSVLTFLQTYKFDGLDLDWEYPAQRDGRPEDKANYVTLVKELKHAFEPYNYTLTATVKGVKETMEAAFDLPKLGRYLDFIHMLCFDYHGAWNGVVGANVPLKSSRERDYLSVEYAIKYILEQGVSPSKMVLSLALHGRTFILQKPDVEKVEFGRTAVKSQGFKGPYSKEDGYITYNEICLELSNESSSWTRHWDHASSTPYLRDKERVISYDDAQSLALKVKMAIAYNLGGVMLWRMDTDDFKGACANATDTNTRGSSVLKEALKVTILPKDAMQGKAVVCYVASWASYFPDAGKFDIYDLDPSICTHLVYAFGGLDEATMTIKSLDPWQDMEKWNGQAGFEGFVGLKQQHPNLKVIRSIGGWPEGSLKFSKMAASQENRRKFIQSVLTFLEAYKFDGLDLDWEYPAQRDSRPEDKANYVTLVKELKQAFEPHNYTLTATVKGVKETMEAAYDLPKLGQYLDFIHMLCFDYHGAWNGVVGANVPLKSSGEGDYLNVEYAIKYMLEHGVSPSKMVLSLPLHGRTFILQNPDVEKVEFGRTAVQSQGFKGPYSNEDGYITYNEICLELSNKSNSWRRHWDDLSSTPYLRDKERVVSYDDAQSIALKIEMAMSYGLGGVLLWRMDTDDFNGACAAITRAEVRGSVLKEVFKFSADSASSRSAPTEVLSTA